MSTFAVSVIVYINGVKFSPMNVAISASDGSHLSFSVDVPAVPEWDALPERSHCAVFFADPVSNAWRFMCEGEYIGYNKMKSAQGARRRSLLFRGLHAMWDTVQLMSVTGLGVDGTLKQIVANSQSLVTGTDAPSTSKLQTSLAAFLATEKNTKSPMSIMLMSLIDAMVKQSPVDTFYHSARAVANKTFAFADVQITQRLNVELLNMMMTGIGREQSQGKTLSRIIGELENVALYHHVPLLAPPMVNLTGAKAADNNAVVGSGYRIPEMLFIPHLYGAIPPACNVIFTDQIVDISATRNFLAEPTRVIAQIETGAVAGNVQVPAFVVVNSVERAIVTNSIIKQSSISFRNDHSAPGMRAGICATHDLLTTEEYHRGVIPHFVSLPMENFGPAVSTDPLKLPPDQTRTGATIKERDYIEYVQAAARTHFEAVRAGARSANVTCTFLPYVAVGFPCLIEDKTGPFWGIISAVTHIISATGAPSTSLQISHVREAYAVDERLRNVPLASWICDKFYPDRIEKNAYNVVFGTNVSKVSNVNSSSGGAAAGGHSAMLPTDLIMKSLQNITESASNKSEYATKQINLDELARLVMNVPSYTKDFSMASQPVGSTIAANIHSSPDPGRAALEYQYRPGVSLSQYAEFHALPGVQKTKAGDAGDPDFAFGRAEPDDLDSSGTGAHKLFAAPQRMVLMKSASGANAYGPYELASADFSYVLSKGTSFLSPIRQNAARMIKAAINAGITEG